MFLLDTNVISELRKKTMADSGVSRFFSRVAGERSRVVGDADHGNGQSGQLRLGDPWRRHDGAAEQVPGCIADFA